MNNRDAISSTQNLLNNNERNSAWHFNKIQDNISIQLKLLNDNKNGANNNEIKYQIDVKISWNVL